MKRPLIIALVLYTVAGAFMVPMFMDWRVSLVLPFHWHKALHVLGAIMLVGNLITQLVWSFMARRSDSWKVNRWTMDMFLWLEALINAPAFVLITANGMFLASAWGSIYQWSWMIVSMILLGLYGVFGVMVMPLQLKLGRLAEELTEGPDERYRRLLRKATWLGLPAQLTPVAIVFIMVLKPRFW